MLSGMQTGVGAVIISVVYEMAKGQSKKENRIELAIIMVVAFMASYVFDISVIYIILVCIGVGAFLAACILEINVVYIVIVCGLIGLVRTLLSKRRSGK